MVNISLLSLSDGDKRLIFSLLLILVVLIAFIALLGFVLLRIMKLQSRKIDTLIHDVVVYKVITDKKHLVKYGRAKNWALFLKQAVIPLAIILVGLIILFIRNAVTDDWHYPLFSTEVGFGTLFWTWKSSGSFTGSEYDLIRFQKIVLDNTPHLAAEAWASYIVVPCFFVGGIWYVAISSCLLSRTALLYKRSRQVFEKSLDGYRQDEANNQNNPINPIQ